MYTPKISDYACITIRRLAWALEIPMTSTMERIAKVLPTMFDPAYVCQRCKDQTKCSLCAFRNVPDNSEVANLLAM